MKNWSSLGVCSAYHSASGFVLVHDTIDRTFGKVDWMSHPLIKLVAFSVPQTNIEINNKSLMSDWKMSF